MNPEWEALLLRILASKGMTKGKRDLLLFLAQKQGELLAAKIIHKEHFKKDIHEEPATTRMAIKELKSELAAYAYSHPNERWRCVIEDAKAAGGYQLIFVDALADRLACDHFWNAHIKTPDKVFVVCGSHLFFHDPETNSALRYYDFNFDGEREGTLRSFEKAHPEAFKENLQPWYHSYLSSGEVHAFETLQRWFHEKSKIMLRRMSSRETQENMFLSSSPVLLGRPDTNRFIKKIMEPGSIPNLGYRIGGKLGSIKIDNVSSEEREALKPYPLSESGVLGPMPTWEMVFGLVTRVRNPSGYGAVTIISADSHARVVSQIADSLTREALAKAMLLKTGWLYHADMPESFEMLFSVRLSPAGFEGEGHPELLCWRPREEQKLT